MPKPTHPRTESIPHYYIGVDPGDSGGLACVYLPPEGSGTPPHVESAVPMPSTELGILKWMSRWIDTGAMTVLEKVQGYMAPQTKGGDSGFVAGSSAMFNFGWSYGGLRMALAACMLPFAEVRPQEWQKTLGITARGRRESKTKFKNRLKRFAEYLYPRRTMTLAIADAVLIAEYCRVVKPLPTYPGQGDIG